MKNRTAFKYLMKPAFFAALLGGMFLLATSPLLISSQGNVENGGTGDHGDNPVVGSLPCAINPELDLMFGAGSSGNSLVAVLGMLGGQDLSNQILDANGTPYGMLNRGGLYTTVGLVHDGFIQVARADARKAFMWLQQWLPNDYLGGTATLTSTIGNNSRSITTNVINLPLMMIAASPAPVANGVVRIQSVNNVAPVLVINISAVGNLVTVSYTPE
jgi:hypothetical protein